ncbi:hypothetical protein P5G86_09525 [Paenibacillus jamilae]|uniref:Uncharacterized protein n=1 Tax=Bacillus thuringiensis serovar subtoxicus TaxID=475791 RepID=A0A9X6IIS5_BACTU|nr:MULTISPECIES: hypothetical protein [Bacillaceae]MEB4840314.1 hypothetical protein [Paenibacillus jamilae]MEB8580886.1 hypothetical protein [Bacillus cereus]MCR6851509.1 hypothetical protein [Bacillus thuringiensis]MDR4283022.1 hypothetical protein [Bacillus thuringiensis]MEB8593233.1 hypothetical protein [Bacillus cereus]
MKESNTIKQNEREKEYADLLVIYEHYIYEIPSKEGYTLTDDDIIKLITGFCKRYGYGYLMIESRLYNEIRKYNEVIESL